ncbi:TetR/AcrR family transcriptional regulator C-terminal domain-containing protein [Umezawaea sp. Da 62-37]|uniref:TetR/AcrR family transcriptional regulator n=1 Tax=Umezawaea sp. Da 62-37 TaxID=3075927 RepID=UPI0028F7478E|nr:TetR/AcrR family transcriptional regulator C-terminal domain-containing protein [Umezawaea sp. Da 62-37]WNV88974.1 TetR/AcrR family transcriptional regulator C-terminal domain-containing protein [Umezawaea sp. Da 62-37]
MARAERRSDALTRERIVEVAVELLDSEGESGLTFRALALRLETGHGAIQWHIANKSELLRSATAAVVARALDDVDPEASPRETIHAVALGVFGAIEAHPWAGGQLARPPWRSTMLDIFERVGRQVLALGVPDAARFTATSALLIHIIGAGNQEATNSRSPEARGDRQDFLDDLSAHWAGLDPEEYAFTRTVAGHLRTHDDRAEFLAGIDLIIDGMTASAAP